MRRLLSLSLFLFSILFLSSAYAGNKPWGYILDASKRFVVLPEFYNLAVLDRATGLIWTKTPRGGAQGWAHAHEVCYISSVGVEANGRRGIAGWRLPEAHELLSLLELRLVCSTGGCGSTYDLPIGHPFELGTDTFFWSSTPALDKTASNEDGAWAIDINGLGSINVPRDQDLAVWCVRG